MAEEQRILIVDDDPDITAQIRAFLTGDRLVIDVAHDTETAVKKFPAFRPHLVLLDVNMPGVSGFVALRRLKSLMSEHGIDCRVVMLTAQTTREDVTTARAYGADDYVSKPLNKAVLLKKLPRHLPGFVG